LESKSTVLGALRRKPKRAARVDLPAPVFPEKAMTPAGVAQAEACICGNKEISQFREAQPIDPFYLGKCQPGVLLSKAQPQI
jgi:hypothetical protein